MAASLDRIFSEIAQFSKTMGSLHGDFLGIVRRDIGRFLEETDSLQNQMQWQGWTTVALTSIGASLAIAGALIPKTVPNAASATPSVDVRLSANAGLSDSVTDTLSWLGSRLGDNDFLRSTCKTSSKFFNGLGTASEVWYRGTTTQIEAKRSLLERVNLQEGQKAKSEADQAVQQAQSAISRILDSKARGG